MKNGPRLFAYTTAMLVLGLAVIVFSEKFLFYISTPGWSGYLALIIYGLVYLNISYGMNRRYTLKQPEQENIAYLLAVILFVPPAVWVFIKDTGLTGMPRIQFLVMLIFACLLGSYFGIRTGKKKHKAYMANMIQQQRSSDQNIPEEMRKPHDKINRN